MKKIQKYFKGLSKRMFIAYIKDVWEEKRELGLLPDSEVKIGSELLELDTVRITVVYDNCAHGNKEKVPLSVFFSVNNKLTFEKISEAIDTLANNYFRLNEFLREIRDVKYD